MADSYDRRFIIESVKKHFEGKGFVCDEYPDDFGEVRMPLYCFKKAGDSKAEEIGVDVITDEDISSETHMRNLPIDKPAVVVQHACSLKFFQYYLPWVGMFWAYGDYARGKPDFEGFRKACKLNGIGLLEVSKTGVTETEPATPLHKTFVDQIEQEVSSAKVGQHKGELVSHLSHLVERLEEEYIHYIVYYADPQYRRRAIVGREDPPDISIALVNRLRDVSRLQYRGTLTKLAADYMYERRDDPEIALETIRSLWRSELRVRYPDVHKPFESVLRLDRRYRDHFLHQFQVFLLGALIIDRLYDSEPVRSFKSENRCSFERAWLATSTYHDFNYMIEGFETWMRTFLRQTLHIEQGDSDPLPFEFDIEKVIIRDEFLRKIDGLFKAISDGETGDCELRFVLGRAALDRNHAALGALTFLNKFRGRNRLKTPANNHAAASILLHDEKNWRYFCGEEVPSECCTWEREFSDQRWLPELSFATLPLAFLLAFCDNVQEWGRKGKGYADADARLEEIEFGDDEVIVTISLADDAKCRRKWLELKRLGVYLADSRFGIRTRAQEGSFDETVWMTGKQ